MKPLIFSILIILAYNVCHSQTEISSTKAKDYVGEYVIVTGKIMEIKESSTGDIFLNFEDKYPQNPLTIVVYASDRENMQCDFRTNLIYLVNETITVSGIIENYQDKPEIILKKEEQLAVVN